MAKKIKLEVIKTIYDEENVTKEIWTTRIDNEKSIEKIWKLTNQESIKEFLSVMEGGK